MKKSSSNDLFYLVEKGVYPDFCLKKHFTYKYDKVAYNELLKENEIYINNEITKGNIDEEYIKYTLPNMFFHKECVNDSLFRKKDLQFLMEQEKTIRWNQNKIDDNKVKVLPLSKSGVYFFDGKRVVQNKISKPIYNESKNLAMVTYESIKGNIKLFTLKKKNNDWIVIRETENHF